MAWSCRWLQLPGCRIEAHSHSQKPVHLKLALGDYRQLQTHISYSLDIHLPPVSCLRANFQREWLWLVSDSKHEGSPSILCRVQILDPKDGYRGVVLHILRHNNSIDFLQSANKVIVIGTAEWFGLHLIKCWDIVIDISDRYQEIALSTSPRLASVYNQSCVKETSTHR